MIDDVMVEWIPNSYNIAISLHLRMVQGLFS